MEVMIANGQNRRAGGRGVETGFGYGFATLQNPSWTLDQILLATGGRLLSGKVHADFRSIVTDSRTITPGDLFLALAGETYDGATFVNEAIKKGAAGVIVARLPEVLLPVPVILVRDTLRSLGDLAAYRRSLLKGLEVLAVTGSSGKTTVKEMVAAIMKRCGNVLKAKGNFNNLIGLPLSLLPVNYRHDYAVLELGMNAPGEISRLTEIADPDIVCINNIQEAHLAGLGSIEGVARAKGELFDACRSSAVLVVNQDDPRVVKLAKGRKSRQITFGLKRKALVRATHLLSKDQAGLVFTLHIGEEKARVHLQVLGEHNVMNCLAAAAMAFSAGADITEIAAGLESVQAQENRLHLQKIGCGLKVINDSYNANPASMQAAMATVRGIRKGERTVAILGDMLELGKFSSMAHCQLGELAAWYGFSFLFAVGEFAGEMVAAARQAGMSADQALSFGSKAEIVAYVTRLLREQKLSPDDLILLKGSRGMRMEEVLSGLERLS